MAAVHRQIIAGTPRVGITVVAAATATALAVGYGAPAPVAPPAPTPVRLAAAVSLLPPAGQVHDVTGGLGNAVYDFNQKLADQLIRAVVNGINLSSLAQAAGLDPQSLVTTLLADIPANLLPGILATLGVQLPVLGPVLDALPTPLLTQVLQGLGISEITDGTLTGLLALIGLDLSDPFDLGGLAVPGLNVITAGPTFTALKLFGLDLGWTPSLPNSVAAEINGSPYLEVGVDGLLDLVRGRIEKAAGDPLLGGILGGLGVSLGSVLDEVDGLLGAVTDPITGAIPDLVHVRVTPTIGIGLGAFAAAMAYRKVIDDLKNQPGGSEYQGTSPILGSLTILPLVLINNPARPNGGAFARFGALAALLGIDTVNPKTSLTGEGGLPLGATGLHLGGANVLPILLDATYEYQPLSDLASWPNPFSLLNNLAAGLSPTYMLRGLSLDGLVGQAVDALLNSVGGIADGQIGVNAYLTLHSATLPLLEPLYLASDALSLVGLGPLAALPMRLANALAPALTTLVNLGYADAVQNADGTVTRDLTQAGTETPFLSFPKLDYGRIPGAVLHQLFDGFGKEFLSKTPTAGTPNVLTSLLGSLLHGDLGGLLGGLGTSTLTDSTLTSGSVLTGSATDVPKTAAKLVSLAATATTPGPSGGTSDPEAKTGSKALGKALVIAVTVTDAPKTDGATDGPKDSVETAGLGAAGTSGAGEDSAKEQGATGTSPSTTGPTGTTPTTKTKRARHSSGATAPDADSSVSEHDTAKTATPNTVGKHAKRPKHAKPEHDASDHGESQGAAA